MAKISKSLKQSQVDKATTTIVIIVSIASVFTAFSLVAVKTLLSQRSYQARVISQQDAALKVAKADVMAVNNLQTSYQNFNDAGMNIINGTASGTGPKDGPNAKIILDALPSQYDFPALVSSLEKLVNDHGLKITALSGIDDASQADAASSASPVAVQMPFELSVTGSYAPILDLVNAIEHTIRPINIDSIGLSGGDNALTLHIKAKTYYQPAKNLNVTTKVVI